MPDQITHTIFATFRDRGVADIALDRISRMQKAGVVNVDGAAVLSRDDQGKVSFDEMGDLSAAEGAKRGGAIGAAVGLLFAPGIVISTAVGAAIGGAIGRFTDGGTLDNDELRKMGEHLKAGEGAVLVIAGDNYLDEVIGALDGHLTLTRQAFDAEHIGKVIEE